MDLDYPKDLDGFRAEVRQWLEEHLPAGWLDPSLELTEAERAEFNREWPHHLAEGGWVCASWPKEYGGKGLSTMEAVIVAEEFQRAGAPMRADFFGDTLVGPTILQWGTEAQKQEFIPKILRGEIAWCQGFSEPDAGSDLGSLKTTAVLDGDEWIINGQKIWTTQGMEADYIFVLCRTDPSAPKHKGISYLLCPMHQPGVEVRRIRQPDGGGEFCEVFFTDARCPVANVVGGVDDGWKVAMTTLGFERGVNATTSYRRFERELDHVIELARANGAIDDPIVRQALARCWSKVQIMRINGLRSLSSVLHGKEWSDEQRRGVAALSATNKLFWSEYHQEVMELAMRILGMRGQLLEASVDDFESVPGYGRRKPAPDYPANALQSSFFFSRSETIWGGSGEIQRNIVGERSLGLPRANRADRGDQVENLTGKVAVVTGGGSGLGAAMARVFAAEGMRVAVLDIDAANAEAVAHELDAAGTQALSCAVDVATRESVQSAATIVDERFGGCDILCANVGVQQFGAIDRLTAEDWQWVLSVNVMGVVHTVDAFLPLLRASTGERHIVLTSSSSAFTPGVRLGAYVTSKFAVTGYGEVLREELAPEGIGVTIVFPAGMSTRHLESSKLARPDELGESVMLPDDIDAMMSSRDMKEATHVATPEHAVRNLVADLQANEPYVITHGAYRPQVEARFARIIDAFRRMEQS